MGQPVRRSGRCQRDQDGHEVDADAGVPAGSAAAAGGSPPAPGSTEHADDDHAPEQRGQDGHRRPVAGSGASPLAIEAMPNTVTSTRKSRRRPRASPGRPPSSSRRCAWQSTLGPPFAGAERPGPPRRVGCSSGLSCRVGSGEAPDGLRRVAAPLPSPRCEAVFLRVSGEASRSEGRWWWRTRSRNSGPPGYRLRWLRPCYPVGARPAAVAPTSGRVLMVPAGMTTHRRTRGSAYRLEHRSVSWATCRFSTDTPVRSRCRTWHGST